VEWELGMCEWVDRRGLCSIPNHPHENFRKDAWVIIRVHLSVSTGSSYAQSQFLTIGFISSWDFMPQIQRLRRGLISQLLLLRSQNLKIKIRKKTDHPYDLHQLSSRYSLLAHFNIAPLRGLPTICSCKYSESFP